MRRRVLVTGILGMSLILGLCATAFAAGKDKKETKGEEAPDPVVVLETSMGAVHLELYPAKAPITVESFLSYVREGFYDGLIFHRVIDGFMIQGGGFTPEMQRKATKDPIQNEAGNGLKNDRGTVAMARTNVINSATSQFFINLVDNAFLDHKDDSARGFGYCVFGKVVQGMDVVDKIKAVQTTTKGMHKNVPAESVVIQRAHVVGEEAEPEEAKAEDEAGEPKKPSALRGKEKIEPRK